ncbi:MAG TPA: response regulator transcription factor [Sphingomicrobium sp.]|jgi:two-component system nitrate/nitrite response regulator NarP|nr:response regulator transcription factor [Sphingomicrobium sp.]
MTSILLADDHPMIRTAIEVLLRDSHFEIAATAASGEEALRRVEEMRPDILLLDLQMPAGSGMDVVRELSGADSAPRIVILTAAIDDASLIEAQTLGVRGMVLKNSDPAYLLECLDRVSAGSSWLDPELSTRVQELSDAFADTPRPALAPRERQLIRFVRQGLRNREIAQELGVTEGTVKVYLHAVFEKLGVSSRTELAVRADEFLAGSFLKK